MPIEYLIDLYSYIYKIKRLPLLREGNLENNCFFYIFVPRICNTVPANAGDTGLILGSGRSPGEEMATHYSILAWKIPWTEEPGRLQSMGSLRVGHD